MHRDHTPMEIAGTIYFSCAWVPAAFCEGPCERGTADDPFSTDVAELDALPSRSRGVVSLTGALDAIFYGRGTVERKGRGKIGLRKAERARKLTRIAVTSS